MVGKMWLRSSLFKDLLLWPIDQIERVRSTCESRVEPMDIIRRQHLVGHVTLVHIYVTPLSALCFVTSNSIRKLHLEIVRGGELLFDIRKNAYYTGTLMRLLKDEISLILFQNQSSVILLI